MFAKPQKEHEWLDQLVGDWITETNCQTPDGSTQETTGDLKCRTLGGMWLIMDGSGTSAECGDWSSVMTLGFDPEKSAYTGTFVGSMMTHLWRYDGALDDSQKKLVLNTEGPTFDGSGMTKYRDIIEILDGDHWILSSQMPDDDGNWNTFMAINHRRNN